MFVFQPEMNLSRCSLPKQKAFSEPLGTWKDDLQEFLEWDGTSHKVWDREAGTNNSRDPVLFGFQGLVSSGYYDR